MHARGAPQLMDREERFGETTAAGVVRWGGEARCRARADAAFMHAACPAFN
jgi:hypothetical protein